MGTGFDFQMLISFLGDKGFAGACPDPKTWLWIIKYLLERILGL